MPVFAYDGWKLNQSSRLRFTYPGTLLENDRRIIHFFYKISEFLSPRFPIYLRGINELILETVHLNRKETTFLNLEWKLTIIDSDSM